MSKKRQLRSKIEEQVAYEEKAFKNVEKLSLTDSFTKKDLEAVINQIMPGHYTDIIEERSISKLCGYPLCKNKLAKIPKQNFHISLKQKKIYDITERKCFCCNFCFKASKYLESQIPIDPLWLRKDKFVSVEFLEKDEKDVSLGDHQRSEGQLGIQNEILEKEATYENSAENPEPCLDTKDELHSNVKSDAPFLQSISGMTSTCLISPPVKKPECIKNIDIDKLCTWLQEWCTIDTFKFFDNSDQEQEKSISECKEVVDLDGTLKADDKSIFMERFLKENNEWNSEVSSSNDMEKETFSKAFISPPVDSRSQQTIRRRIVSQKLRNGFTEAFSDLGLSLSDFRINIATLIKTFRFTNQNITLKAKEWKLVATAILKRIAIDDESTALLLKMRKLQTDKLLSSCNIEEKHFDKMVEILKGNFDRLEVLYPITSHTYDYDNDTLD